MGAAEQALVIDDDDEFCQWARSVLEQEGFDVVTTSEPKDAIQLVYASEPGVVLVDIALGPHDGFSVARKLRDIAPRIPIILISSLNLRRATHVYMGVPRPLRLTKPFAADTLAQAVRRAMRAAT